MPTKKEHPVPKQRPPVASPSTIPDWEAARIFLEVTRIGSFRAAARTLRQSINALRRKVDKLEVHLGTPLITRHIDGIRLTAEGERLLDVVQRMELVALAGHYGHDDQSNPAGDVKVAVTEGLATFWIVPHLPELQRERPNARINLLCGMSPADVARLEAEIAIQFSPPTAKDLKVVKLCRLHFMPFAAERYLRERGAPTSVADLSRHRLLYQSSAHMIPLDQTPAVIQQVLQTNPPLLQANASSAVFFGVVSGLGIAMLPTYAATLGLPIVPIDLGYHTQHNLWLVYHPDAGRSARVQFMIQWLMSIFSPKAHPWFRNDFVDPRNFGPNYRDGPKLLE